MKRKAKFMLTILASLIFTISINAQEITVNQKSNHGYFWGLDGLVSTVSSEGNILKQWFSIASLGKAISKTTIERSNFGQNYFLLRDVTTRRYYVFTIDSNGYTYPKHVDFGNGRVSSVELGSWVRNKLFKIEEIMGDGIGKLGGNFFFTRRGYLAVIGNKGELYIITKNAAEEDARYRNVKTIGGNYFFDGNKLFTVSVDALNVEEQFLEDIKSSDVIISGGNYFITKTGRFITFENYLDTNTNTMRVRALEQFPQVDKEVLLNPFFYGGNYLSYRASNAQGTLQKESFVLTVSSKGQINIKEWKCFNCSFDYDADGTIQEDETRNWDWSRVPPKERYGSLLTGHNYIIFVDGSVWTVDEDGNIKMAIRINVNDILDRINRGERGNSFHDPVASNFPYR